jgi:hypothetical protein
MTVKEIINILLTVLERYLFNRRFTGKIVITLHCRDGAVGKCVSEKIEKSSCVRRAE